MPPAPDLQGNGPSVSNDDDSHDADATVPRAALLAEREKRQAAELAAARLEGQVGALQQTAAAAPAATPTPQPTPETYSRAQLKAWVEEGTITEEAAQTVWDEQTARASREAAENVARSVVAESTAVTTARSIAQQYIAAVPQISVVGSPENMRVQAEYQKLVESGSPPNDHTTTIALRFVYGAPELLAKGTPAGEREVHNETGGRDNGGDNPDGDNNDGSPKGLTKRERDHYTRLINTGAYTGWDQVKEEMKFADQKLRDKMRRVA